MTVPKVRDCPSLNESLHARKHFRISESVRLQFGAEMFNLFNRHQWFGLNQDSGVLTGERQAALTCSRVSF
jgi:hypothetical protein